MSATARLLQQENEQQPIMRPAAVHGRTGEVVTLQTLSVAFPKKSLVFGILAAFCLCFLILVRYGAISELNMEIGDLNTELASLKDAGRMLKVGIESELQLDVIRAEAETRLGMHAPSTHQVIPVQIPKSAYSVVTDAAYLQQTGASGQNLWNRLVELMGTVMP